MEHELSPPKYLTKDNSPPVPLIGEQLLIVQRKYWFILLPKILVTISITILFIITSIILFINYTHAPGLLITSIVLIFVFTLSYCSKTIVDWFFHLYIVTNRKILELSFKPLFSQTTNEILLGQVRCTEIDVRTYGLINEILDMGNIVVTFDRPTNQEEFVFRDIKNPRRIAVVMEKILDSIHTQNPNFSQEVWYQKDGEQKYRFIDEIRPTFSA